MLLCELQNKDVINISDCMNIGHVVDLEFCEKTGCIHGIVVPGPCKLLGMFGREYDYHIPWCCINRIGEDIILVDVCLADCKKG